MVGRRLVTLAILVVACFISLSTTARKAAHRNGRAFPGDVVVGRVVSIADGDTLKVLDNADRQHRIRLFGIDAPEKAQAFGKQSKKNLADKVFGETVRVEVVDIDRYGREVGRIYLGERFINLEQVRDGCAWRYTTYDRHHEFDAAEAEARTQRRGLWAAAHPTPPWEYRHARRTEENHVNSPRRG
jgi:endonuclease YncB( thermonuclease family)